MGIIIEEDCPFLVEHASGDAQKPLASVSRIDDSSPHATEVASRSCHRTGNQFQRVDNVDRLKARIRETGSGFNRSRGECPPRLGLAQVVWNREFRQRRDLEEGRE